MESFPSSVLYEQGHFQKSSFLFLFQAFSKSVQLTSYNIYTWVKELTRNFLMCVSCLFLPAAHPALLFSSLKRNLPQQRKPLALLVPPLPAARAWRQWASLGCLRCLQCAALHFRRLTALPVQAVPIQPHSVSFLAKLSSFSLIQFAKLPVICQKFSVGPQDSLTFIHQGAFKNCVDKTRQVGGT